MEQRYTVTQTAEILGVRASVLRYWEEELELRICRNEQGHRYYTGNDITLLANIKELKKRGLALRAIKELVPRISRTAPGTTESKVKLLEDEQPEREKMLEFQKILQFDKFSMDGNLNGRIRKLFCDSDLHLIPPLSAGPAGPCSCTARTRRKDS